MLSSLAPVAKAVAGGLVSGLTTLAAVLPDGVTQAEWIAVALSALAGLGVVYYAPANKPAE